MRKTQSERHRKCIANPSKLPSHAIQPWKMYRKPDNSTSCIPGRDVFARSVVAGLSDDARHVFPPPTDESFRPDCYGATSNQTVPGLTHTLCKDKDPQIRHSLGGLSQRDRFAVAYGHFPVSPCSGLPANMYRPHFSSILYSLERRSLSAM